MPEKMQMSGHLPEMEFDKVAERVLILFDEVTRRQTRISVQIGRPYWTTPDVEAACPVAIEGLLERRKDIRGIDTLQALELAIKFADSYLADLPRNQKLTWLDGESYS